jgi:hypothetical protein
MSLTTLAWLAMAAYDLGAYLLARVEKGRQGIVPS